MGEPVVATISNAPDGARIIISPFPAETLVKPLLEITHPESRLFWGPDGWQPAKHAWPANERIGEDTAVFSVSRKPNETELPASGEVRLAVPAALIRLSTIWSEEARVSESPANQDMLAEAEAPAPPTLDKPPVAQPIPALASGVGSRANHDVVVEAEEPASPTPDKAPVAQPIPVLASGVGSRLGVLPAIAAAIVISLVSAVFGAQFQIRKLASATEDLHRQSEAVRVKDLELQRLSQAVSQQEVNAASEKKQVMLDRYNIALETKRLKEEQRQLVEAQAALQIQQSEIEHERKSIDTQKVELLPLRDLTVCNRTNSYVTLVYAFPIRLKDIEGHHLKGYYRLPPNDCHMSEITEGDFYWNARSDANHVWEHPLRPGSFGNRLCLSKYRQYNTAWTDNDTRECFDWEYSVNFRVHPEKTGNININLTLRTLRQQ